MRTREDILSQLAGILEDMFEVPADTVDRYGIVKYKKDSIELEDIIEKPEKEESSGQS